MQEVDTVAVIIWFALLSQTIATTTTKKKCRGRRCRRLLYVKRKKRHKTYQIEDGIVKQNKVELAAIDRRLLLLYGQRMMVNCPVLLSLVV